MRHDAEHEHLSRRPLPFVLRFLRPDLRRVAAILSLGVVISVFDLGRPYALKLLLDRLLGVQREDLSAAVVALPLLLFVTFQSGGGMVAQLRKLVFIHLRERYLERSTNALFAAVTEHSPRFFSDRMSGNVAAKVSLAQRDAEQILHALLILVFTGVVTFVAGLAFLSSLSLLLGCSVAAQVAIMAWATARMSRRLKREASDHAAARSRASGQVVDAVTNIHAVKIFAREERERAEIGEAVRSSARAGLRLGYSIERVNFVQSILVLLLVVALWGEGAWLFAAGRIGAGDFVAISAIGLRLSDWAERLGHLSVEILSSVGSLREALSLLLVPPDVREMKDARPLAVRGGAISFEQVDFAYEPGRPIFRGLNVEIRAGEKVVVVGASGAGKTSFLHLLLRFNDPAGGSIRIDGQPIRAVTLRSLREAICVIPQEPLLFHRSLRENIRYSRLDASDEEIERAARLAQAHDFIVSAPGGYDALVGDRGVKLSGGQRQRIAVARAFLKRAPIIALDEATASLDAITEQRIRDAMDDLFGDRTVIRITHRLSAIGETDRILVFHEGAVVEDGGHAELIARGGMYARLCARQARDDGWQPHLAAG